ncbi:MAG TPA: aminotransferase class V-fold PLP-dependent enzyme [Caldithrix abyssi]|uniref:Aminotransferase class V-fold PLP-dependent enzyme n=1 Tax=Caldithrix abyssi TaxID=187145 RepID=A0A7V5UG00_CALAY|nr:aminotransferase class V-fold PLP-dependent enzyme [Caldithrix abyssi]
MAEQKQSSLSIENAKEFLVGYDRQVPLLDGRMQRYVNFDNAASTPTLKPVLDAINEFMPWYSSIHRGTGFKSQLSTHIYEYSRDVVRRFCNIHDAEHTIIFGKNSTEAINKLARRIPLEDDSVIFTTRMEHHSNDLPWRMRAKKVVHLDVDGTGRLDMDHLKQKLTEYRGRVRLVAVTGASNVTGYINPIKEIARLAHEAGAEIMVDAAQLAPHRPLDMGKQDDPEHIDYLAFSAHKIYAPFGLGVLVANRTAFEDGEPDMVGGGTISIVSMDHIFWADVPEKEEAGTPNVVGAVALAKSLQVMMELGMDKVAQHEARLTAYALKKMKQIPGMIIYGSADEKDVDSRLGVISFNLQGIPHALVASVLNYEYGIGVRNGCFCAHPYIKFLLGVSQDENKKLEERILHHDRSEIPGAVRISFGIYNDESEIDYFIDALTKIAKGEIAGDYALNKETGEYRPGNFELKFDEYFKL